MTHILIKSPSTRYAPAYVTFIQRRLSAAAILFISLYAASLTLSRLIHKEEIISYPVWRHWLGYIAWLIMFILVNKTAQKSIPARDPYLLHLIYLCSGWGLLTVWRLSPGLGLRQTVWFVAGSICLLLILRWKHLLFTLKKYSRWLLAGCFILISFTLLPALTTRTSQPTLWLNFAGMAIQPSEPLKLFFIVYLSAYFSDRISIHLKDPAVIIPSLAVAFLAFLLLLAQRDLGTTTILVLIYILMVYLATGQRKWLIGSLIVGVAAGITGYFLFDVIRLRVEGWLNPWLDPVGRSYQVIQALISQAAGGVFGTGPGMGSPTLVPVAVSDFVFTAIAEETGTIGAAALLLIVLLIAFRGYTTAIHVNDRFSSLLAMGISTWLAGQSLLIIAGNIRLLPLTGVTLPFFSYGGSSLLTCLIASAFLLTISSHNSNIPRHEPYRERVQSRILPAILLATLAALMVLPYWSVFKQNNLLDRNDNLRRAIADYYIPRGDILDRNGELINSTSGEVGSFERIYAYPQLGTTTGYTNITFGKTGAEDAYDDYLRGLKSYEPLNLWWSNLLYSHPPTGKDLRLTLDLSIQSELDAIWGNSRGGGVILNAATGEVLAISSNPWFDPAKLDKTWNNLITDTTSPLLNRALAGKYPLGTLSGIFLAAGSSGQLLDQVRLSSGSIQLSEHTVGCSLPLATIDPSIWLLIQSGCPLPALDLSNSLGNDQLYLLFKSLGFYNSPDFALPVVEMNDPVKVDSILKAGLGQERLEISPLQVALATAAISNHGVMNSPVIGSSFQSSSDEWKIIPARSTRNSVFTPGSADAVAEGLTLEGIPAWGAVGQGISSETEMITWFIGGTNSDWAGTPITLAIVYEGDMPQKAMADGSWILNKITAISGGEY